VNTEDSLQLLTIHTSKGLQFKRVFVFYNLSGGHSIESARLAWALQYADQDFHLVRDFGISFHYQKVLKASSYRYLWEAEQNRELLEEMNNLYVAFTRAECKLHLYFTYENKDGWGEYLSSRKEESLPALLCDSCLDYFKDNGIQADSRSVFRLESPFKADRITPKTEEPSEKVTDEAEYYASLLHNMPISTEPDWANLSPVDKPTITDWKRVWLIERPNLFGDLAHYYLSFIIRNHSEEHVYALRRCLLRYGSLLHRDEIIGVTELCHHTCNLNPQLFDPCWDKVFTELEIKGNAGLLRIDRLMLNTDAKQALIVDYKSGQIHDSMQLQEYRTALQKVNSLKAFEIDIKFLKLV
jgi:ATP-dependent exoDNAse (exonuclease V) beta subunit